MSNGTVFQKFWWHGGWSDPWGQRWNLFGEMNAPTHFIWSTDAHGNAGESAAWRAFTGQTVEEVRGLGWLDAVHPEDRQPVLERWQEAVASRQPYEAEYRVRGRDGQYLMFVSRGMPVLNESGDVHQWLGFCTDITARKAAEEDARRAARASEQLRHSLIAINACMDLPAALKCLLEQTIELAGMDGGAVYLLEGPEAVLKHHQDLGSEFASLVDRGCLQTNYIQAVFAKPGEVINIAEIFPEQPPAGANHGLRHIYSLALMSEKEPFGVMNVISRALHPPAPPAIELMRILVLKTESTFKRLMTAQRLQSVLTTLAEGVVVHGPDGRIVDCNPSAERILGLTRDEIIGGGLLSARWRAVHSDGRDFPAAEHPAMVALRTGLATRDVTMGIWHSDGKQKWININTEPMRASGGGAPRGVVVSFSDITQRRQLEGQLRQSQKMESIGHVAGGLAHEFNNILAAMMLNLEIIRGGTVDGEVRERVGDISGLILRASALIRQLLAFSGQSLAKFEVFDLAEEVSRQVKILQPLLGEKMVVEFTRAAGGAWVRADKKLLAQVFMNLCLNAREAMPAGGRLELRLAEVTADEARATGFQAPGRGPLVCLAVTDTGCGMEQATLRHLFEPFFTTKGVGQGTGLGLATAQGIVEQHQGRITVESKWGKGSTFRVFLPTVDPSRAGETGDSPDTLASGSGTILVVDDEPELRTMTKMLLTRLGYTVLVAANGREALNLWRQERARIQLILTDMVMPGDLSGLQWVEEALTECPGLKAIITSGYTPDLADLEKAAQANLVFLPKPCPPATLMAVIRHCLQAAAQDAQSSLGI